MKAKIVSQVIYDSPLDFTHGLGQRIKRLIIEEAGNLAITLYRDQIIVFDNFQIRDGCAVIGEVEVSSELINKAFALLKAQEQINALKQQINDWLNQTI